jgi:hypothetical protein
MGWALMAPPAPQLTLDYLEGASWAPLGPPGLGPDGPPWALIEPILFGGGLMGPTGPSWAGP